MRFYGRRREIESLVKAHYRSMYRYAFRLCGDASFAEDLTQEAFCKAQAKLGQLREKDKARAWLFRILRNEFLKRAEKLKKLRLVPLDCHAEPFQPEDIWTEEIDPEDLQAALAELPETFRTPVVLYYFEDFSYQEIAAQLDVPIGTVMSRLSRAKQHLREKLAPLLMETV